MAFLRTTTQTGGDGGMWGDTCLHGGGALLEWKEERTRMSLSPLSIKASALCLSWWRFLSTRCVAHGLSTQLGGL